MIGDSQALTTSVLAYWFSAKYIETASSGLRYSGSHFKLDMPWAVNQQLLSEERGDCEFILVSHVRQLCKDIGNR